MAVNTALRHSAWLVAGSLALFMAHATAEAATRIWTGGSGADGSWTTAANWAFGVGPPISLGPPDPNDSLTFTDSAARKNNDNTFAAGTNFGALTINGGGYNIIGNAISLGAGATAGGITANFSSGMSSFNPPITLGKSQTFANNGTSPLRLGGTLTLGSFVLTLDGPGVIELAGTISGPGAGTEVMIKNGAGTMKIPANTANFGRTTVNAGTLHVSGLGNAGTVALVNGRLTGDGTVASIVTFGNSTCAVAPGSGATPGVLTAGPVTLASGCALEIDIAGAGSNDRLGSFSAQLNNAPLQLTLAPGFSASPGSTFNIVTGPGGITGTFAQGGFVKAGSSAFSITYGPHVVTLTLMGTKTWSGASTGPGDANWMTPANWVGGVAPVPGDRLVFPSGAARLASTNDFPANTVFDSIAVNTPGYVLGGNAIRLLGGISESGTLPGARPVLNMDITLDAPQTFSASANGFDAAGKVTLTRFNTSTPVDLTIDVSSGIDVSGVIEGGGQLIKQGSGQLHLKGNNTYTGMTSVEAGSLRIAHDNALGATGPSAGTTVASGATLILAGSGITVPERLFVAGNGFDGAITGNCTGNCTLSAPITIGAATTIGVTSGTLTISNVIDGAFPLQVRSPASAVGPVLVLGGDNTVGTTTVNRTRVIVNGKLPSVTFNAANGGTVGGTGSIGSLNGVAGAGTQTVAPGASAGILTALGNASLTSGNVLAIELGGTTAGTGYDRLQAGPVGVISLGGATLALSSLNGFIPPAGSEYDIVSGVGISGQFAQGASVMLGTVPMTITYGQLGVKLKAPSADFGLTVTRTGSGSGTVSSADGGIACGGDCVNSYVTGASVTLTAMPLPGSTFTGWLGACVGTDPCTLSMTASKSVTATFALSTIGNRTLDVDLNNQYDALTDGLMVIRSLFALTGTGISANAIGASPARSDPAAITAYLADIKPKLDADGNGAADALTDGLLIMRFLFQITGDGLIQNAIGTGATRTTPAAIQNYLGTLRP